MGGTQMLPTRSERGLCLTAQKIQRMGIFDITVILSVLGMQITCR